MLKEIVEKLSKEQKENIHKAQSYSDTQLDTYVGALKDCNVITFKEYREIMAFYTKELSLEEAYELWLKNPNNF